MGCCPSSSGSDTPLTQGAASNASPHNADQIEMRKSVKKADDKVELAFKVKRANVFNTAVDLEKTSLKKVPKSHKQIKLIASALTQNYIFAAMNERDLESCMNAMEIIEVPAGESVITQGKDGDYFYIIESGNLTILVDNKQVGQLTEGQSFGELALLYNSPRNATIRSDTNTTLFGLDRISYKYILAHSSASRTGEAKKALRQVPILFELTDDQFEVLTDSVELFSFNAGDIIIKKGTEGKVFYMIKEGSVVVGDVGEQFTEVTLSAGDYFGERALMTGEPRDATVTAKTKVLLMALDRDAFNSVLGPLKELLDHNTNLRVLGSVKLFSKLNNAEKKKLSQSFEIEKFSSGTTIIKQGDQGSKFYIVKDGSAKVVADGVEVGQLTKGSYFGEMALLDDEMRKANVIATSDVECFVLDRLSFSRILGSMQHVLNKETLHRLEVLRDSVSSSSKEVTEDAPAVSDVIKFSDLQNLGMLGSGTFGRVSLVQDKKTKNVYALKAMLKSEIVAHKQQANVINEKNIMLAANHPFILRLYQTYKDPKKVYMLLEFVQGGELFSVLHTSQRDGVPESQAKFYGAAILSALSYLHSKEIAYRDMKPENCLIDKAGYPKLVDFGFAKVITGKSFTLCGTPEYLAPELVLARGHNKSVDYWAYGILIYEMIAGYSPFSDPQGMDQVVICKNIVNGRLVFPRDFNQDCKDLVKRLLVKEVQARLGNLKAGTDDIKNHKWFQGFDFDALIKRQIKAPWTPKVSSVTDTSNFDPYGAEDHVDDGYVDRGNWDKDF